MIFVTIGTTMPFDELFIEIDRLIENGVIHEEVICQTGQSKYKPKHCKHFDFKPNVDDLIEKADKLIVHGGTGSTIGAILSMKPFMVFTNPRGADDHQVEFLEELSKDYNIVWSKDVTALESLYNQISLNTEISPLSEPELPKSILEIIGKT